MTVWPSSPYQVNFETLGLNPALQRAVTDMGLYAPTPIQAQAIPPALQGRDVWATAPTGSGKTLAFALPLVQQHVLHPRQTNFRRPVRSLVLVPTRELALQVGDVLTHLAYAFGLKVAVVYGGVSINPQMMGLRGGADFVVATPGRLLDLAAHNAVHLAGVQHLVLEDSIDALVAKAIVRKQTLASLLRGALPGVQFNAHLTQSGDIVFRHACKMVLEGIVSKRLGSRYRSGRSPDWLRSSKASVRSATQALLCQAAGKAESQVWAAPVTSRKLRCQSSRASGCDKNQ